MMSGIPLPQVPEGGFVTDAMMHQNALTKSALENLYYGPKAQAEMALQKAQSDRSNQLLPLDIQNQSNINQMYIPNIKNEMAYRSALASQASQSAKMEDFKRNNPEYLVGGNIAQQAAIAAYGKRNNLFPTPQNANPVPAQTNINPNNQYGISPIPQNVFSQGLPVVNASQQQPFTPVVNNNQLQQRPSVQPKTQQMSPEQIAYKMAVDQAQADIDWKKQGGANRSAFSKNNMDYLNQVSKANPQLTTEDEIREAGDVIRSGGDTMPDGSKLNVTPTITGALSASNKTGIQESVLQKNARLVGINVQKLINEAQPTIQNVVKYSGLLGKGQKTEDYIAQQFGKDSQEFKDYNNFVTITVPQLISEYSRLLGKNSTDKQNKMMESLVNPVSWNNPKVALAQWNLLVNDSKKLLQTANLTPEEQKQYVRNLDSGKSSNSSSQSAGRVRNYNLSAGRFE